MMPVRRGPGRPKAWWRLVAQAWPCETCGVGPGERCLTLRHNVTYTPHACRTDLASANGWQHPDVEPATS